MNEELQSAQDALTEIMNRPLRPQSQKQPILNEEYGCYTPFDNSFEAINEFTHHPGVGYEDLQYALLGIAASWEKEKSGVLSPVNTKVHKPASCPIYDRHHQPMMPGDRFAYQFDSLDASVATIELRDGEEIISFSDGTPTTPLADFWCPRVDEPLSRKI